jgi:hypothetical protein
MNSFQNYVFVVTFFCLIVGLTFTAIALKNNKSNSTYPPVIDNCPDYWYSSYFDLDSSNNSIPNGSKCKNTEFGCCPDLVTPKTDETGSGCPISLCYNVKKLGVVSDACPSKMDFSNKSVCDKQTWAKSCNMTWDGISNMPNKC